MSVFVAALVLAGCGGDGNAPNPTDQSPIEGDADTPSDSDATDEDGGGDEDDAGGDQDDGDDSGGDDDGGDPGPREASVRFVGRFDTRDPARPIAAWPGTRIIAKFRGTSVAVALEETLLPWQEGGPSTIDVRIDGIWRDKIALTPGIDTYVLASGLANGEHNVEIYRRTEAQNGTTTFLGFDFGGGTLLPLPPANTRRIEVIGDSSTTGYGVEGVGLGPDCPGVDSGALYQNFRKSWGALLSQRMSADLYGTGYSGKGIVKNVWRPDTLTLPVLYTRANPLDATSLFDVSALRPDLIILMAGGNDFAGGQPEEDEQLTVPEYEAVLGDFVRDLRGMHAEAHIVLVLSPSTPETLGDRTVRPFVREGLSNVADTAQAGGDTRVYFFEPEPAVADELLGCNGHGTPELHRRIADELEAVLRPLLHW